MTPKKLLQRSGLIAMVYVLLHLLGGRHDAAFLSGTPVNGTGALLLGCAYVVFHFLFTIVAPILAIAALLLSVSPRVAK